MSETDRFLLGFVCMMICVILPLIVFMKREARSRSYTALSIITLYAVWYLTMTTIHESSHYLGSLLSGVQITEVRLIPHFWKGEFVAYVNTPPMSWGQAAISVPAPYVLDLLSLLIGALLLRAMNKKEGFIPALLLTLFCLRPLFDIVSNLAGYAVWNQGDLKYLAYLFGGATIYGLGLLFSAIAIGVVWYLVMIQGRRKHQELAQNG